MDEYKGVKMCVSSIGSILEGLNHEERGKLRAGIGLKGGKEWRKRVRCEWRRERERGGEVTKRRRKGEKKKKRVKSEGRRMGWRGVWVSM